MHEHLGVDLGVWLWSHGLALCLTFGGMYSHLYLFLFVYFILFFNIFLAVLCSMWDLSSPTRDRTRGPLQWKRRVLTTASPGKSPVQTSEHTQVFKKTSLDLASFLLAVLLFLAPSKPDLRGVFVLTS